jgi:hypothetical protein
MLPLSGGAMIVQKQGNFNAEFAAEHCCTLAPLPHARLK